jgi:hypothetical protein
MRVQRYIVFGKYANKKGIFFGNYVLFHTAVTITTLHHKEGKQTVKCGLQRIKIVCYSKKHDNMSLFSFFITIFTPESIFYLNINH